MSSGSDQVRHDTTNWDGDTRCFHSTVHPKATGFVPVMRKTFIAIEELFSMSSLCQ